MRRARTARLDLEAQHDLTQSALRQGFGDGGRALQPVGMSRIGRGAAQHLEHPPLHLLGQKPFESGRARRQVLQGVPVDRSALPDVPRLVIGAGLDPYVPEQDVERLAEWLDAPYEPFGAHSHYGLVLGEQSYLQVAETLRMFLETNRL